MRTRKILAAVALVGAMAVAAVAGTALAQTPAPTQTPGQAQTNYREFYLDRLAAALGTTREQLNTAFTQARNDTVDQAVRDGKLTQEQADRIKSRPAMAPFGFHGIDRGHMRGLGFLRSEQVRAAVAQVLGMTPEELTNRLRSGETLGQLAQGREQAVRDAIADAMRPQLDQAVADGRITQDQANRILERIQTMDLSRIGGGKYGRHWDEDRDGTPAPTPGTSPSPMPSPTAAMPL